MVNNIGKAMSKLNTNLGTTTQSITSDDVIIIAGELGLGFLLFDTDGTLGVVTSFTDRDNFIITTHAISIDIQKILDIEY